jgi:glycyl-tRNA synthetase
MFRTSLGSVDNIEVIAKALEGKSLTGNALKEAISKAIEETAVYLRPETAQAMFVQFLNVQAASRLKPPFGIAQQGKSFRNEITVEHFTFRSCEFEQMEMEFFIPPPGMENPGEKNDMQWLEYWCQERFNWYVNLGIRKEKLRLRPHAADELAHYAKGCYDVEYEYPWGWGELEGIAHRSDYDLKAHEKASGKKLTYFDPVKNVHYHPFVIEPAAGADRTALAFLLDAYTEEAPSEQRKDGRVLLKLHPRLAPTKAAVFPLVKKDGMPEAARKIVNEFFKAGINAFYDEKDAVGRRYARADEAGTPYCLTVDGQTATDGTVTIRERDTMTQERIKVEDALNVVRKRLSE